MRQTLFHAAGAPAIIFDRGFARLFVGFGKGNQSFSGIGATIEQYIFHQFKQFLRYFFIDRQHARIDDSHIHSSLDGVIQECRMHSFTDWIVASEREGNIAHSAANFGQRQVLLDPSRRFNEIDRVAVVLFNAGADCQYVRIENDVLRRESNLFGQNIVRARANLDLALIGIGLPPFVEGHDYQRRAIATNQPGLRDELFFAFFHAERIDDAFAL